MIIFYICFGLIVLLFLYGFLLNFFPKNFYYQIKSEAPEDKRIVLLTDLHANCHGKDNRKLLQLVDSGKPDIVCISGDMIVKKKEINQPVIEFLSKLADRYPVYYSPGNHEIFMPEYEEYKRRVRGLGIHFLENEWADAGGGYWIGGLDLPEYWYHKCWEKRELTVRALNEIMVPPDRIHRADRDQNDGPHAAPTSQAEPAVLMFNQKNERKAYSRSFPVLLAHNPEYFPVYAKWGAGLVLSGHIHGGIARLPFFGGVISPSLRLFPKYDAGLFAEGNSTMVLSRGLGLHHIRLRFFNRPEVSVVDIKGKKE